MSFHHLQILATDYSSCKAYRAYEENNIFPDNNAVPWRPPLYWTFLSSYHHGSQSAIHLQFGGSIQWQHIIRLVAVAKAPIQFSPTCLPAIHSLIVPKFRLHHYLHANESFRLRPLGQQPFDDVPKWRHTTYSDLAGPLVAL